MVALRHGTRCPAEESNPALPGCNSGVLTDELAGQACSSVPRAVVYTYTADSIRARIALRDREPIEGIEPSTASLPRTNPTNRTGSARTVVLSVTARHWKARQNRVALCSPTESNRPHGVLHTPVLPLNEGSMKDALHRAVGALRDFRPLSTEGSGHPTGLCTSSRNRTSATGFGVRCPATERMTYMRAIDRRTALRRWTADRSRNFFRHLHLLMSL